MAALVEALPLDNDAGLVLDNDDELPAARCPTAIARSRNWLLTSLDESLVAEEQSLDRDLDDAIGGLRQWREEQAHRFEEMRRAALAELPQAPAAAPACTSPKGNSEEPSSGHRLQPRGSTPDENLFCAAAVPRPRTRAEPPLQPSASQRVAERLASTAQEPTVVASWTPPSVQVDDVDDFSDLERTADVLREYSSGLDQVLARLHALERS